MSSPIRFYDPHGETRVGHNHLPHWDQMGASFFLTFRLADAVPIDALRAYAREHDEWLASHPPPPWPPEIDKEYRRKFTGRFERWLDRGYGACHLRNPMCSRIVADTMKHFEGERSQLHAWVVMPNHVHVLVSLIGETTLADLMKSWKGYSSRQINLLLGMTGTLWQKSYFDRIIRDWDHLQGCARYIRENPSKAKLPEGDFLHGESDLVRRILG